MPIYEYVCEEPGKEPVVIELIRSAADADKPVPDPEGKGRVFKRRLSLIASGVQGGPGTSGGGHVHSGMCGCGKRRGSCGG
ncbi:MAG: zinc ribbon domain-containing protein [Phycisphaerales bacterium]|nr:zinc ribbon domain-containing protein [Phycisphaerales bacterium]